MTYVVCIACHKGIFFLPQGHRISLLYRNFHNAFTIGLSNSRKNDTNNAGLKTKRSAESPKQMKKNNNNNKQQLSYRETVYTGWNFDWSSLQLKFLWTVTTSCFDYFVNTFYSNNVLVTIKKTQDKTYTFWLIWPAQNCRLQSFHCENHWIIMYLQVF